MTPLRQRMIDDMRLAGFAKRTQDVYIQAIRRLAAHYMRSPEVLTRRFAPISSICEMSAVSRVVPSKPITAGSAFFIRGPSTAIGRCSPKKTRSRTEEAAPADCALPCRGLRHLGCGAQSGPQDLLSTDVCLWPAHRRGG